MAEGIFCLCVFLAVDEATRDREVGLEFEPELELELDGDGVGMGKRWGIFFLAYMTLLGAPVIGIVITARPPLNRHTIRGRTEITP